MLINESNYAVAMEKLDKCDELAVDDETNGTTPWLGSRQCGIAIGGAGDSFYFPFRHAEGPNLPLAKMADISKLLSKPHTTYIGWNYGFDMKMQLMDGCPLPSKVEDVQQAIHLLNENEPGKHGAALKPTADKYLGPGKSLSEEKLIDKLCERFKCSRKDAKGLMWKLPASDVADYACNDVIITKQLRDFFVPHLKTWKLYDLWQETNEYLLAITEMEIKGFNLDVFLIHQYIEECEQKTAEALAVVENLAGYKINLRSPKQVCAWLGVPSSAEEALEAHKNRPGVKELLAFRGWATAASTYYHKYLEYMDHRGILHANLNLTGTISGRLTAEKPNLQALPERDEEQKVKDVFVLDNEEEEYGEADFSQAEMRVAAHYGEEKTLAEKLIRGANLHTETAEQLTIPYSAGKRMNFSVIYGIGKKTLAERLGIPEALAGSYLQKYHRMYPGFRRLYNRCQAMAEDRGYIKMYTGRLRHFNVPEAYSHKASSNLIQGCVAEMERIFILGLRRLGVDMRLQVHDSVIFVNKKKDREALYPEIKRLGENQPWCSVPHKIDMKHGPDLGHTIKWEAQQ